MIMSRRLPRALSLLLALGACQGTIVGGPESGGEGTALEPAPPVLPRLTASQYTATVQDLFGPDVPIGVLPADTNPHLFFSIGATSTELSELGAQQYADAADAIASWVVADLSRAFTILGCTPATPDDACITGYLDELGRRLYRRPLTSEELASWTAVARDTAHGDVGRGLRMAIYGLLQSPPFLYRVELGEPDPEAPGRRRYSSFEMASRISFLLWDRAPDRQLLDVAATGALTDDAGLRAEVDRLLAQPEARRATQGFFAQYLDLAALDGLERDGTLFPAFSPALAAAAKDDVRLRVDEILANDADVRTLFASRRAFVNSDLAALYGVDAPGATPTDFVPVELPADGPRAGVLTSAAFLTMNAHVTETSPTLRGKFVRERVLCQRVPAPGDNVDLVIDEPDGVANTLRERLERHVTDPSCASCHAFIDPPGYLFEGFDAIGAARTTDRGYPVDTTGDLDGVPLADARDLADRLATDPRVGACLVRQLYRHASGRLETDAEGAILGELDEAFAAGGYRMNQLLAALVLSDGFRRVGAEDAP